MRWSTVASATGGSVERVNADVDCNSLGNQVRHPAWRQIQTGSNAELVVSAAAAVVDVADDDEGDAEVGGDTDVPGAVDLLHSSLGRLR